MAEFVVDTQQLRSYADQISALQRELDSVAMRLAGMQLGSVLQIKASTALIGRVGDCKWAAVNQSDNLGKLARGLDDIAELYDRYETNLSEPKTQAQADAQAAAEAEESENWMDNIPQWLADYIMPLVGAWGDAAKEVFDLAHTAVRAAGGVVCNFLSLLTSLYSNAVEFDGDFTNPRFWAETIGEVAVDVAMGAFAAAVAAAVGLSGGAAAAAAVAAVWAAKVIVGLINGQEVSETISDGVIDIFVEITQ